MAKNQPDNPPGEDQESQKQSPDCHDLDELVPQELRNSPMDHAIIATERIVVVLVVSVFVFLLIRYLFW